MESKSNKKSIRVKDFMTEEEEKEIPIEINTKDEETFNKRKADFNISKIVSEFVLSRAAFIQQREGDINTYYTLDSNPVGEGAYGVVYKATEKESGEIRAVKVLEKAKIKNYQRFINEITALRTLDHPNVIKLYELFEDKIKIFLVQEFCSGGELFDQIAEMDHFDEEYAAKIFEQILHSLIYCHKNKICHRDLKPENFMFTSKSESATLKLIDFGLSRSFYLFNTTGEKALLRMKTKAGTAFFMAPEVIDKNYSSSCDMWSAGVILYIMLSGYPPFDGETQEELYEAITLCDVDFDDEVWEKVSEEAKDLIMNLLTSEDKRLTAKQALKHKWFKRHFKKKKKEMVLNLNHIERLRNFQKMKKMRKAILVFLASRVANEDIQRQLDSFYKLDKNNDGYITIKELQKGLKDISSSEQIQSIMESVDIDKNGAIDYSEFVAATLDVEIAKNMKKLEMAFTFFDKNGDGKIDQKDMTQALAGKEFKYMGSDIVRNILQECDSDGDGAVNYKEFMR